MDRRDLLDAGLLEQVARRERALDRVGRAGTEVVRVGARRGGREVGALGQRRVRVGRRDLVILAEASTGCTLCATLEFSVPTTPTTSLSDASLVAAFLPTSGLAWSSSAASSSVQPGMALLSFACLMARSTEFLMPRPRAARSPDRGAMTPILAVLLPAAESCHCRCRRACHNRRARAKPRAARRQRQPRNAEARFLLSSTKGVSRCARCPHRGGLAHCNHCVGGRPSIDRRVVPTCYLSLTYP